MAGMVIQIHTNGVKLNGVVNFWIWGVGGLGWHLAIRNLRFLKINCSEFNNPNCLYFLLERSILEFGSDVWNPLQIGLKNKIEIIQRYFLRMIAQKFGLVCKPVKDLAIIYQIPTLESRWLNSDVLFIHKYYILFSSLLKQISLLFLLHNHVKQNYS
jgi:hypothetical protein